MTPDGKKMLPKDTMPRPNPNTHPDFFIPYFVVPPTFVPSFDVPAPPLPNFTLPGSPGLPIGPIWEPVHPHPLPTFTLPGSPGVPIEPTWPSDWLPLIPPLIVHPILPGSPLFVPPVVPWVPVSPPVGPWVPFPGFFFFPIIPEFFFPPPQEDWLNPPGKYANNCHGNTHVNCKRVA